MSALWMVMQQLFTEEDESEDKDTKRFYAWCVSRYEINKITSYSMDSNTNSKIS